MFKYLKSFIWPVNKEESLDIVPPAPPPTPTPTQSTSMSQFRSNFEFFGYDSNDTQPSKRVRFDYN